MPDGEISVLLDRTRVCKQVVRYDAATDDVPRGEKPAVDTIYVSKAALEDRFGEFPRTLTVLVFPAAHAEGAHDV